MTEYWKSQARKYCDFCKCWIADNKVSISFHENGKRHKENAQKHIAQLYKKSSKDQKQKDKMDDQIKKMEKAAMVAYMKDLEDNADITSQNIISMLGEGSSVPDTTPQTLTTVNPVPSWQEVSTDDGNSYYWNIETNETVWDPPENYISVAEQKEKALKEKEKQKAKQQLKIQQQKEAILEVKAMVEREKLKERAVTHEVPTPYQPPSRNDKPYGSWTPVVNKPEVKVDLQLPKVKVFEPPVVMEPEVVRFKEKKVESLGEGPVDFKKRKLNSKRNTRQKTDDD